MLTHIQVIKDSAIGIENPPCDSMRARDQSHKGWKGEYYSSNAAVTCTKVPSRYWRITTEV